MTDPAGSEQNQFITPQVLPMWLLNIFPLLGFVSGLLMWLIDSTIDVYLIHPDESLLESIFSNEPTEIWMRALVMIVMTLASIFAQHLLRKQKTVELLLRKYQLHLEDIVEERTGALVKMASVDSLTGIYNRRKFSEILEYEAQRSKRYHQPLALLMIDIDHFKHVNDTYGHQAGDEALIRIADIFKTWLRKSDVYARWGGEEFIVLLTQTNLSEARLVAEKLRQHIAEITVKDKLPVTASFGVSLFDENEDTLLLVKRADDALYQSKNDGRNRVSVLESTDKP